MSQLPKCDVAEIEETTGPRGGRLLVLTLACGTRTIWPGRKDPPTSIRCFYCFVKAQNPREDHVDEYVDDLSQPACLRWFLFIHRLPAIYRMLAEEVGAPPRLFATYEGKRVRVVMASRLGDVGITTNLSAHHGYEVRVLVSALSEFSQEPQP